MSTHVTLSPSREVLTKQSLQVIKVFVHIQCPCHWKTFVTNVIFIHLVVVLLHSVLHYLMFALHMKVKVFLSHSRQSCTFFWLISFSWWQDLWCLSWFDCQDNYIPHWGHKCFYQSCEHHTYASLNSLYLGMSYGRGGRRWGPCGPEIIS